MKPLALILTILIFAFQTQASVSVDEFISDFTQQTVRVAKFKNKAKRAKERERLYFENVSQLPVSKIRTILKANPEITVGEFATLMAESYYSFPPFTPNGSRKSVIGMSLNNTSYAMNYLMVIEVLEDLNAGDVRETTKLLDSYNWTLPSSAQ